MIVWGLFVSIASADPAAPDVAAEPAEAVVPPAMQEAPPEPAPAAVPAPEPAPTGNPLLAAEAERLLGPAPPPASPEATTQRPIIDTFSWWPFALAAVGAGLVWYARKRVESKQAAYGGSELRVVGRADLGQQSGLAVVEVRDREGTWRRLVIGTGDGTPQLVADLGEPQFGLLGAEEESTVEEVAPLAAPSMRSREGDLPRDFDSYDPLPSPSEVGLPPLPADPKSGRALVHEVLGERRRRGRPQRRSTSFQTFA